MLETSVSWILMPHLIWLWVFIKKLYTLHISWWCSLEKRTLKKNYHKFSHQPQYISLTPDQKFRVCTAVGERLRHPLMEWTSNYLHCLYYILLVHIDQHQLSVGSVSNMMIFFFCLELREGVKFKFISLLFWYKKLRVVLSYDMTI